MARRAKVRKVPGHERAGVMNVEVLRDTDVAQRFLLQGLWFQRAVPPAPATVRTILEWGLEIAHGGRPLPPLGVVADFGHVAFGADRDPRAARDARVVPGLPPGLLRTYEDYVLGKLYTDRLYERAGDAMRGFQGRDRARGLAFVVARVRERWDYGGVELSPAVLKALAEAAPDDLLRRGSESLSADGPMPLLVGLYEALNRTARQMADVLTQDEVIELEHRTALADEGQSLAHRLVLRTAGRLEARLPRHKLRPLAGRREVPTRVLDEDTYPVGGFTSISTRGSVESLLHSQLAYMEADPDLRPDLFDVKYLRDELYYYSRDENQFLRRRRTYLFCLYPDLVKARFQDPGLPVPRIILALGVLTAAIRKLSDWLSTDALTFEFLLVQDGPAKPLAEEGELLEMLFREQIGNGTVLVKPFVGDPGAYADARAQRSLCHVLTVSDAGTEVRTDTAVATGLAVPGPRPVVRIGYLPATESDEEDAVEAWTATLEKLLRLWV